MAVSVTSKTMNNVEGRLRYKYIHTLFISLRKMATCVATWSFGKQAVEVASRVLSAGGNCIDSLERGVNG